MRILVTGGAGFVGSHLSEALRDRGDDVVVLDSFDTAYDPAIKRRQVPTGVEVVEGDIRDRALLDRLLPRVDAVAHLAARAGVRESLADPGLYASVNVEGTAQLLAALGDRPMVFASSSSVYGARHGPFLETEAADIPASPYAASKRAAELFCAASGRAVTCARLFTVYGPRQRPAMAIAKFVRQVRAGEELTLFGDGSSIRDYTFVSDVVDGLMRALDRTDRFRIVNLGGGSPIRLDALVAEIGRAVGREPRIVHAPMQAGDVPETRADITLARAWLGWSPAVGIPEGLRRYVAWTA